MNGRGNGEEMSAFEVAIVVPKRKEKEGDGGGGALDCVEFLVKELERAGLIVEIVNGISDEFIKVRLFFSQLTAFLYILIHQFFSYRRKEKLL